MGNYYYLTRSNNDIFGVAYSPRNRNFDELEEGKYKKKWKEKSQRRRGGRRQKEDE